MSTSLRSAAPVGVRRPAPGPGQTRASDPPLAAHDHDSPLHRGGLDGRVEWPAPTEGPQGPSSRPGTPESGLTVRDRCYRSDPGGPGEHAGRTVPALEAGRPSGDLLSRSRPQPGARSDVRFGRRRGVAGLVAVCVLALGVAACSVRDAKAEASASASASASAAIARAEKGIAEANASATASREAALTPELRAKRDAALAEPAPAKPPQMNEENAEGAAASVGYFLNLYRYAYVTGNTTELAKMSEDQCKFCRSTIDNATTLHNAGGWNDKWEQEITNIRYYEKLDGYDFNRVEATVSRQTITSHPGGGAATETSSPTENEILDFAVRYVGGRWMIGGVRVEQK